MPLDKIIRSEGGIIGIWNITEGLQTLTEQLDQSKEDGSFKRITSKNKLKEWCAVRLSADSLMSELGEEYQGIYKDEFGKPHLAGSDNGISVSHSYPYVAVIINPERLVGIDIEFLEPRILRLAHKFMCEEELEFANGNLFKSGVIWSAKESLYKLHGRKQLIFSKQLIIEPFAESSENQFYGNIIDGNTEKYELGYIKLFDNKVIVVFTKKQIF